jgi:hypothetical protein
VAEIADDNDHAIDDLLSIAGEEVFGFDNPTLEGEEIEAHRGDAELDEIVVAGGEAEAGGFTLTVRKSDFEALSAEAQIKGATVISRDDELELLSIRKSISHVVLTVGQFAASDG